MNHLNLVADRFSIHEHGLRQEDVLRKDRQNWASAQRIMFLRVRHCLSKIQEGHSGIDLIIVMYSLSNVSSKLPQS